MVIEERFEKICEEFGGAYFEAEHGGECVVSDYNDFVALGNWLRKHLQEISKENKELGVMFEFHTGEENGEYNIYNRGNHLYLEGVIEKFLDSAEGLGYYIENVLMEEFNIPEKEALDIAENVRISEAEMKTSGIYKANKEYIGDIKCEVYLDWDYDVYTAKCSSEAIDITYSDISSAIEDIDYNLSKITEEVSEKFHTNLYEEIKKVVEEWKKKKS